MALDPIITQLSYSTDKNTATITDTTVYGTGGNPARSAVAVFLELWKMDSLGADTDIEVDNDEPETVTTWDFDSSEDGWYKARIYIVPDFDIGTAYTIGQAVYYASTGLVYLAIDAGTGNLPTDTDFFSASVFTATTGSNNVTLEYQDYLVIEHGKICAGEAAAEWYKSQNCSNCDKIDLMAKWLQKHAQVVAAEVFASTNLYNKAEEIARKLETSCESC
jgi:hypothetical protein